MARWTFPPPSLLEAWIPGDQADYQGMGKYSNHPNHPGVQTNPQTMVYIAVCHRTRVQSCLPLLHPQQDR